MNTPSFTAVVTGAGSGVGRAVTLKLAREGWSVALIGRRAEALAETIALAEDRSDQLRGFVCDLADPNAVAGTGQSILAYLGHVDALVNAAGTNIPRRSLDVLSLDDYHSTINANLHGAYHAVQAFLPGMRERRSGTIVNINSEAGMRASAKAGAAYVISKFGLAGLSQTINAEERVYGVRACSIFPGDIETALLEKRPNPPSAEARKAMMQPEDIAACVWLAISLPGRAVIEELVVRPR